MQEMQGMLAWSVGRSPQGIGKVPWSRNGNPFQYFCLENSMDRGAWRAIAHGAKKSWTQLSTAWHGNAKFTWLKFCWWLVQPNTRWDQSSPVEFWFHHVKLVFKLWGNLFCLENAHASASSFLLGNSCRESYLWSSSRRLVPDHCLVPIHSLTIEQRTFCPFEQNCGHSLTLNLVPV